MMKIVDNVLLPKDLFNLYSNLINTSAWNLARSSFDNNNFGTFPGMVIRQGNDVFNFNLDGYFTSLFQNINNRYKQLYGYNLPHNIHRIHLGAKNDSSETEFHCDEKIPNSYTIVGFLTPVWDKTWGAELLVESEKIDVSPGKFIVFKTNVRHNGLGPTKKIPYWRISINYVVN